ncbi:MAG: PQ-loop domain-containing transporter [Simkaniaceae bacterium]|nr:PQ-loop domain-containing transporter [Simkaniaceae bacterium]
MFLYSLSWIAIFILSISYWFQIWKIHVHKEVRDISLTYNLLLAIGFGILGFTAYDERSLIFFVKQISTTIPVIIIVFQVIYHRDEHWKDTIGKKCEGCSKQLERRWKFCAHCGREAE